MCDIEEQLKADIARVTKFLDTYKWDNESASFMPIEARPTVCAKCRYYVLVGGIRRDCTSEEAPYTDFVNGFKCPGIINDGHCKYYKRKKSGRKWTNHLNTNK